MSNCKKKGFTLVEIIVVLVILAVLAAVTIPSMQGFITDAKEKTAMAEARLVMLAAKTVRLESGTGDSREFWSYKNNKDKDFKDKIDAKIGIDIDPDRIDELICARPQNEKTSEYIMFHLKFSKTSDKLIYYAEREGKSVMTSDLDEFNEFAIDNGIY